MTLTMSELMSQIVAYKINEDAEEIIHIPSNTKIHTGITNSIYILLYILIKTWGNQEYFLIKHEESFEMPKVDDMDNLSSTLNPDALLEIESELKVYGIYLKGSNNLMHNYLSTLVILSTRDLESPDLLCLALRDKLAGVIPNGIDPTNISMLSPEYIYIEGIRDYKHYRELMVRLSSYNCSSILLYSDSVSYNAQISQINHEKLVHTYMSTLGTREYLAFNENSKWIQELCNSLGVPTFESVRRAYNYIINLPEDLFIIDSFDISAVAINILALAYCTHHKQSVFNYASADAVFNSRCSFFMSGGYAYLDTRIKALYEQYEPDLMSVHYDNQTSKLIKCNYLVPNIKFKLAKAEELLSFIKFKEDEVLLAIESDILRTPISIITSRQLDLDATVMQDGEEVYRYDIDNIISFINRMYPGLTMLQAERFIYALLRLMEQLMESYSVLHTIYDILVVKDLVTGTYMIGFGSMSPQVNCDILQLGSICCVIQNRMLEPGFLDFHSIFDYTNLTPRIKQAYMDSGLALPRLTFHKYEITHDYLIDMALYHIASVIEQESSQYLQAAADTASRINYRVADRRNLLLSKEFLPFASEFIQSYGLRLLKPETAPVTIYGGLNEKAASSQTGRINLYVDAMKHLPMKKGE